MIEVMDAPLLQCFPFIREPVLRLLTLADAVSLLSSCRALRGDSDAVAFVLHTIPVTRHFGHGCRRDWLLTEPHFDFDYSCYDAHEALSLFEGHAASASLLSLVGLLQSKLWIVWYEEIRRLGRSSYTVPFILPAQVNRDASREELRVKLNALSVSQRIDKGDSRPALGSTLFPEDEDQDDPELVISSAGLHWENLEVKDAIDASVVCRFCESIEQEIRRIQDEAKRFVMQGGRMSDELRDAGYDETFLRAIADHNQEMGRQDARYDWIQLIVPPDEAAYSLFMADRLPLLKLMGPKSEALAMCVGEAAAEEYVKELCPEVYRPLRQLLSANKFTHVRRVNTTTYTQADQLPTINSVEMVGGLSPHGYYAGVFLVQVNPW